MQTYTHSQTHTLYDANPKSENPEKAQRILDYLCIGLTTIKIFPYLLQLCVCVSTSTSK